MRPLTLDQEIRNMLRAEGRDSSDAAMARVKTYLEHLGNRLHRAYTQKGGPDLLPQILMGQGAELTSLDAPGDFGTCVTSAPAAARPGPDGNPVKKSKGQKLLAPHQQSMKDLQTARQVSDANLKKLREFRIRAAIPVFKGFPSQVKELIVTGRAVHPSAIRSTTSTQGTPAQPFQPTTAPSGASTPAAPLTSPGTALPTPVGTATKGVTPPAGVSQSA